MYTVTAKAVKLIQKRANTLCSASSTMCQYMNSPPGSKDRLYWEKHRDGFPLYIKDEAQRVKEAVDKAFKGR